jgi:hypothetical protein
MKDWNLTIIFHLPHERLALGWDFMHPEPNNFPYYTFTLYLGIVTLSFDVWT